MGKKLVIVESPAKAKTINKILGSDFLVKHSMGHVRDLPVKKLGVDVKKDFKPDYVLVKGRKKLVDELKRSLKECDAVYLAPDPDREGEAIAWHLRELLKSNKKEIPFYRVQYNEITPRAVRQAIENPIELDMNRVDAQQARRVLDRIVGYMVSPVLWRQLRRGLSAGRVQSVALRLVSEREEEIQKFVPEPYWIFGAMVRKIIAPLDTFAARLTHIDGEKAVVTSAEQAERVSKELEQTSLKVARLTSRDVTRRAQPPFITSTLQQAASTFCGFAPRRTMSIAQKLYEGIDLGGGPTGLITYMRTDSVNISQDARNAAKEYIVDRYGNEYYPEKPNTYRSRSGAQEAHEAIRPTDVTLTPERVAKKLDAASLKLYRLIWQRFVASQMAPAVVTQRAAEIEGTPEGGSTVYLFRASTSEVKFPGYMKVSGNELKKKNAQKGENGESDEVDRLPPLNEGEPLVCTEWLSEQKETKPPSRYSEASLIRALERNGVGRPSTYAQTLTTLHQRKYVTLNKRSLVPTELGMDVNRLLVDKFNELFNVQFTADMEERLDRVEEGDQEWVTMLRNFYGQFEELLEKTKLPPADVDTVKRVLASLSGVKEWAPPVKRGKRTFSDERFVQSVHKQLETGEKPVSQRQLEALMRIGARYLEQVPEFKTVMQECGFEKLLKDDSVKPPRDTSVRKLELLKSVELDESGQSFSESLRRQVEGGRRLSPAQVRALDNMVVAHAGQIEDFEKIKPELELGENDASEDSESAPLLESMKAINEWREPVTRGKRVFNDKTFFESLATHFDRKGFLTPRQRGALRKMASKYREQIPNYDQVMKQLADQKKASEDNAAAESAATPETSQG